MAPAVRAPRPVRLPKAQRSTEVPRPAEEALRRRVGGRPEAAGLLERAGRGDGGEAGGGAAGPGGLDRQASGHAGRAFFRWRFLSLLSIDFSCLCFLGERRNERGYSLACRRAFGVLCSVPRGLPLGPPFKLSRIS